MKSIVRIAFLLLLAAFVASLFAVPTFAADQPKDSYVLPAKIGNVTFNHKLHATDQKIACVTCHHASKPEKPLKGANEACGDCHTSPPTPQVKTSLQAAFHNPTAKAGLCIGCHQKQAAAGKKAPAKCTECHKKA